MFPTLCDIYVLYYILNSLSNFIRYFLLPKPQYTLLTPIHLVWFVNNLHPSLCILKTQTSGPLLRCNELGFLGICTSISCPNGCCAPQVSTTQKRFRKKVDQDGNYLEKFISSEYFYKDSPEANLSCASTMKNYRNSFIYRLSFHLEKIYTRFSFNMSYSVPILLESGYTAYKKRQ